MNATECACRQAERDNLVSELAKTLEWALSQPGMSYSQRLKQNAAWCDKVDEARALLARAKEQQQ